MPGSPAADKALRLFRFACDGLPVTVPDVLRKIAMTVRAEAYRSLHTLFPEEANRYLDEAKALLHGVPDRDARWRDWLDDPYSPSFPGIYYWY